MMKHNAMPVRMTMHKKSPQKHVHKFRRTTIEPTQNGGYVVEHMPHGDGGLGSDYGNEEKHAFADAEDMHDHIQSVYPKGKRANTRETGEQA